MVEKRLRIFWDVDTQNDFMNKDGALYIPDAEEIKPNLKLLTQYAKANYIPVLGSVDNHFGIPSFQHREGELKRYGGPFPDHCMDNAHGQEKIYETVVEFDRGGTRSPVNNGWDMGLYVHNSPLHDAPKELVDKQIQSLKERELYGERGLKLARVALELGLDESTLNTACDKLWRIENKAKKPEGIYFEKQNFYVFTNPMTEELLLRARVKEAVVYGVAIDYCVKAAVLGMQKRGIQTYLVIDAVKGITPETTRAALEEITAAGCKRVTTADVLEGRI